MDVNGGDENGQTPLHFAGEFIEVQFSCSETAYQPPNELNQYLTMVLLRQREYCWFTHTKWSTCKYSKQRWMDNIAFSCKQRLLINSLQYDG